MTLTTNTSYEDFLPEVIPYVRDVSEVAALASIRNACIEFCTSSTWLRDTPEGIDLEAGEALYDMDYPIDYSVAAIVSMHIGQHELKPGPSERMSELFGGDWRTVQGRPSHYQIDSPTTVRLVLTPDNTYTDQLNMVLALSPTRKSTQIDTQVFERWAEAIAFGARARLHDTPQQPYYDPQQAIKFRRWFETMIGEARIEAQKNRTRGPLKVKFLDIRS